MSGTSEPGSTKAQRRYRVMDVFADVGVGGGSPAGNPLAVVVDGEGLSPQQMQAYANWTNLSETTFLLPPTEEGADYRVRIFTPDFELPFAGHPTLGSCRAWLDAGGRARGDGLVVQECGAGLVPIRVSGEGAGATQAFRAPPRIRSGPVDEGTLAAALASVGLGPADILDSAWIDNGPGWLGLLLPSADAVLAVEAGPLSDHIGLIGFHGGAGTGPHPEGAAYEVRAFFLKGGQTAEDPVTGSLNASAAQWMVETGRITPPYTATQGTAIGRNGLVTITASDAGGEREIWVGGAAAVIVSGTVEL